jgi:hypothetical protein
MVWYSVGSIFLAYVGVVTNMFVSFWIFVDDNTNKGGQLIV